MPFKTTTLLTLVLWVWRKQLYIRSLRGSRNNWDNLRNRLQKVLRDFLKNQEDKVSRFAAAKNDLPWVIALPFVLMSLRVIFASFVKFFFENYFLWNTYKKHYTYKVESGIGMGSHRKIIGGKKLTSSIFFKILNDLAYTCSKLRSFL